MSDTCFLPLLTHSQPVWVCILTAPCCVGWLMWAGLYTLLEDVVLSKHWTSDICYFMFCFSITSLPIKTIIWPCSFPCLSDYIYLLSTLYNLSTVACSICCCLLPGQSGARTLLVGVGEWDLEFWLHVTYHFDRTDSVPVIKHMLLSSCVPVLSCVGKWGWCVLFVTTLPLCQGSLISRRHCLYLWVWSCMALGECRMHCNK